ncbi:MAG: ATPase, T2SS/T4P/T4SS family, partial [Planctomycetota bacterium]
RGRRPLRKEEGLMATGRKKLLGQILKEQRICHEGMIQEALAIQGSEGGLFGQILIRLGHVTEGDVLKALGVQAGMEVIDLAEVTIDPEAVKRIDYNMASMFQVLPTHFDADGALVVAMGNPMNQGVLDDVRFMANAEVKGAVADADQLTKAIERLYEDKASTMDKLAAEAEDAPEADVTGGPVDLADAEAMAQSAPVIKLLNYVLFQAIRDQAADIHLEPFEDEFKIRYRVDGVLYELDPPPIHLATALISRVKVMAGLDISETRLPQDGRIELSISGRPVDLRVSTLPTMFGESCVMRILDRSVVQLDMGQIGLRDDEQARIREMMKLPHGIILVTGPTGCGKTTTLYSVLREMNTVDRKIITTEDPVEYDIEGIMQVQVNEEIGVTFAACLRSILRQDPDVILIGEIRDKTTGDMAVQASLTGHVVFSTVHTNDAPVAVTRLVDLGVEPFLLAATLESVVAQRLVRRICDECRTHYEPSDEALMELELRPEETSGKMFAYGKGCEKCHYTGYKGRAAIFEIMRVTDRIRELMMDNVPTSRLRAAALEEGMRTLRESGLLAIYDGVTTIEEVVRETIASM